MENENNIQHGSTRNAISVYQPDGPMDDFPVLKAFQQYIDAEQNKARKRLVSLCIVFVVLIFAIISVFMIMLHDVSRRNQQLNDRLVEFAMKDRDRAPVVVQPAAPAAGGEATTAAIKAMTDTLMALQKKMLETREQPAPASVAPVAVATEQAVAPAASAVSKQSEDDLVRRERLARDRIRKERAQLAEERRKFDEERARKHQEEVERHRRKLYPEYYAAQDKAATEAKAAAEVKPTAPQQPAKREISDDDIADILREAAISDDDTADVLHEDDSTENKAGQKTPAAPAPTVPAQKKTEASAASATPTGDDVGEAIQYFNDDEDEYEIPVDVKGTSAKWRVPIGD